MAEVAAIGLISSVAQLTEFSIKVVKRLNEYMRDVDGVPQCFQRLTNQLPLLMSIAKNLHDRAEQGDFAEQTAKDIERIVQALIRDIKGLHDLLSKLQPSALASNWEKAIKAAKSVKAQKSVESYATTISEYRDTLSAFQVDHQTSQFKTLITTLQEQKLDRQPTIPILPRKPIWMLDYDPDEDFVGREGVMTEIEERFETHAKRVAVVGMGGVGKSRIALEYCCQKRRQETQADIFWVHGATHTKFEAAYKKIARLLELPGQDDKDLDIMQLVRDHLCENSDQPFVMILDNADNRDYWLQKGASSNRDSRMLIDYLPRCNHGRILITTRDSQLGLRLTETKHSPIQIDRFGQDQACRLLRAKLSDGDSLDNEDANELTAALEYLPLTITQAAAYLNEIEMTAAEYLSDFRTGSSDVPELLTESIDDPTRDRETSNSIFQTWRLSFDQIRKQNSRAAEILALMAMLDRQEIPQVLLRSDDKSLVHFKAAISKLKAFSFIIEDSQSSKYSMHRLVQLSTQQWIEYRGLLLDLQERALAAVSSCCPEKAEFETWPTFVDLKSHIHAVLEYKVTAEQALLHRANILHCYAHYVMRQGQESVAQDYLIEALEIRQKFLGPEKEDTLLTMGLLGVSYSMQGRDFAPKARETQEHVLDICQRVLGPTHEITLKTSSRLALAYDKSSLEESRKLHLQVLENMKQTLGEEHPDTMTEMSHLLFVLNKLKRWYEAEDLGQQVLRLRSKVLGPEHPDTLTIMAQLAILYIAQRRFPEAQQLEEQVLELRLKALGPDHPKTLLAMESLSRTFAGQHRHSDAEQLEEYVLEARTRVLGPEHRQTLDASRQLKNIRRNTHFQSRTHSVGEASSRPPLGAPTAPRSWSSDNSSSQHSQQGLPYRGPPSLGRSHPYHQRSGSGNTGSRQSLGYSPPPPYSERNLSTNWRERPRSRSPRPEEGS